jgi:hypothetical protein
MKDYSDTNLCRGDLDDADAGVARLAGADAVLQVSEPLRRRIRKVQREHIQD